MRNKEVSVFIVHAYTVQNYTVRHMKVTGLSVHRAVDGVMRAVPTSLAQAILFVTSVDHEQQTATM